MQGTKEENEELSLQIGFGAREEYGTSWLRNKNGKDQPNCPTERKDNRSCLVGSSKGFGRRICGICSVVAEQ